MMSPGTSCLASISRHWPSRSTRALRASCFISAATALPAVYSCQKPTAALKISRAMMIQKSGQCRTSAESIAATSIIHGMGPQK